MKPVERTMAARSTRRSQTDRARARNDESCLRNGDPDTPEARLLYCDVSVSAVSSNLPGHSPTGEGGSDDEPQCNREQRARRYVYDVVIAADDAGEGHDGGDRAERRPGP